MYLLIGLLVVMLGSGRVQKPRTLAERSEDALELELERPDWPGAASRSV